MNGKTPGARIPRIERHAVFDSLERCQRLAPDAVPCENARKPPRCPAPEFEISKSMGRWMRKRSKTAALSGTPPPQYIRYFWRTFLNLSRSASHDCTICSTLHPALICFST